MEKSEFYEANVNGMKIKVVRDGDDTSKAQLYMNNKYVGIIPYDYTVKTVKVLEELNLLTCELRKIGKVRG